MNQNGFETPTEWAQKQFGGCQLGDSRRTQCLITIAAAMLEAPGASIPQQMKSWGATKAAYRLLSDEAIQYEDVIEPHWKQTRQAARSQSVVLMVQDLTSLNYSAYPSIQGLGPIGDNKGQGLHMSSVLAILPATRQILGMAYQLPFIRQMHDQHETRTQRAKRSKEWTRLRNEKNSKPGNCQKTRRLPTIRCTQSRWLAIIFPERTLCVS